MAPVGLAILESDQHISSANLSLTAMLGHSGSELIGKGMLDLVHPEDVPAVASWFDMLAAGRRETCSGEVRLLRAERQAIWSVLSLVVKRRTSGEPAYYVAEALNITTVKDAELRLAQYATELERSNQELEQLAYVVSHDLQAPLRTLRGYAQLLREEYSVKLGEQGQRWATYVVAGADRMHVLIGDLLKVARVQVHSSPMMPADLGPIVARAWERVASVYVTAGPEFACDVLPVIPVDEIQIEQVFQNLFDNALKYRREEVRPRVEIRAARTGAAWQFSVSDNGIGLDMSQAGRIFEIFQRLHADHTYDGTGIGLAVCRKIVERHRGRIWVESTVGEGATFHFTIPDAIASVVLEDQAAGS